MATLMPEGKQSFENSAGAPLVGGKLYTYDAGTNNPRTTYQDAAATVPNTNPIILDARGEATIFWTGAYKAVLKDAADVTIWTVDNIISTDSAFNAFVTALADATSAANGAALVGYNPALAYAGGLGFFLNKVFARTAVEIAAGVTPTNYQYPPGNTLRYGTNTTPGTTDMTTAIQNSILCAGSGSYRGVSYTPAGAYKITASLTAGAVGSLLAKPIVIKGDGQATQIINAAPINNPTFKMTGVSQWVLRDMLLTGNNANPNDGIWVDGAINNSIRNRIERIVTQMCGIGIKLTATNSIVIRDWKSWPDNNSNALTIAQTVTAANVGHHLYMTGAFCHDVSIYDPDALSSTGYSAGACGIRCDAAGPNFGIRIFGGLLQSEDLTTNTSNASVYLQNCDGAIVHGPYFEGACLKFGTCSQLSLIGAGNGGLGGKVLIFGNSEYNVISGVFAQFLDINDNTCINNTIMGCFFTDATTPINDGAAPKNRYINVKTSGTNTFAGYDRAGLPWVPQTYSAVMNLDMRSGNKFNIVPNNAVAFQVADIINQNDGETAVVKIRNATGGAIGALTWGAQIKAASTTQPANGFSVIRTFTQDKSYGSGVLWIQTGADVTVAN